LAIPELGTKQICPHCQAKFYDLNKRPAHCPKCGTDFDPDEAVRSRRVRARAIVPDTDEEAEDQVAAKAEDAEDEEEEVVTPELDEVVDEPPLSGDEDEDAAEPGVSPVSDDLGEFTDDEEVEDDTPTCRSWKRTRTTISTIPRSKACRKRATPKTAKIDPPDGATKNAVGRA
jgi:uncharacterized protein (TIGR02300 family)